MARERARGMKPGGDPNGDRGARSSGNTAGAGAGRWEQAPAPQIIRTILQALESADPRPEHGESAAQKRCYAERLSRKIATCLANLLRRHFIGILPDERGGKQESRARTSGGPKKLGVNYSTPELGLALGVSVKTINYRDAKTKRYTKDFSRTDDELWAEATNYHQRHPYAILIAVLFLPIDACDDAQEGRGEERDISSFGAAASYFRHRANRETPRDNIDLFERFFIGLCEPYGEEWGKTFFFDVMKPPPRSRRPRANEVLTIDQMVAEIKDTYDSRNNPKVKWAPD
jgi:hypothetical protein